MHDRLPVDAPYWEKLESVTKEIARDHGFGRLETPILEYADLYNKTTGEESDIVEKEIYIVRTKGDDILALRPEYTPGVCRAYLENSMSRLGQPQKLFYIGPVFRHDRPQLGRYRQFTQVGFEVIGGASDPIYDAQIITIASDILKEMKIKNPLLKINSIGCRTCRPVYKRQLYTYYKTHEKELCADCVRRLKSNPLKLLDCKEEKCVALRAKAPNILDKLCVTCAAHFKAVLEYLDEVKLPYMLDNTLVRGLDYYSRTVFEFIPDGKEADLGSVVGGGRYDYLMETIGVHNTVPALGFALGAERLIAVMKQREISFPDRIGKKIFLAHAGELAKKKAFALIRELRAEGLIVSEALAKESLGAQLKVADKEGVGFALILGQKEIYEEAIILRDLRSGAQESVPLAKLVAEIKRRL